MSAQPKYYRSLSELEQTPEFEEFLHREFPQAASELPDNLSRRRWLQLMGASLALSGLTGCRYEQETIAPFATRAANRTPGKAKHFNTTFEVGGRTMALRATNYDGRPTKLDGNSSLTDQGGSTSHVQALVLELYDPDRGRAPFENSPNEPLPRTWEDADQFLTARLGGSGQGVCVLAEPTSSPTVSRLKSRLQSRFSDLQWFEYASVSDVNAVAGSKQAFGKPMRTHYDLEAAKVIVALDCDLLGAHPESLRNAASFARGREPGPGMSRLYAVESELTTTGVAADHRLALQSRNIVGFLGSLEKALDGEVAAPADDASHAEKIFAAVVDDLKSHRGQGVVAVGDKQPPLAHAIAHRINQKLNNLGKTIQLTEDTRDPVSTIEDLAAVVNAGECETLLVLGGNPVYDAPADVQATALFDKIKHRVHLSLYPNETSDRCGWYLPLSHPLESWTDSRMYDGVYGIGQPQIDKLFDSRSVIELLSQLATGANDALQAIRETAAEADPKLGEDRNWQRAVHDGFIADSGQKPVNATVGEFDLPKSDDNWLQADLENGDLELGLTFSGSIHDGRFANNSWLQELPHPLTKLTWGNAAVMSPATAKSLGVKDHEVVRLTMNEQSIEIPVYVQPGQATGSVSVALGYGRTRAGAVGGDVANDVLPVGVDASPLRTNESQLFASGLQVEKTGKTSQLASTQDHFAIDRVGLEAIAERVGELVREGSLDEYRSHPDFAQHETHHPPLESLWEEPSYDGHAWGMSIDLNRCIGCNACMVACQSENNVPVVGPEQVKVNREMHWIRVDRYFAGDPEQPEVVSQPVACHHCENAPCEQVCPVAATVHSDEGLNDMVYNRCIGTRYCGNNCPYKVRRFNFLDYRREQPETDSDLSHLILNPEVTVRSRGVMEKCTYCVQRIQNTKIDAKVDGRAIGANEIVTACQQACPSQAIEFGDLNNPESRVAKAHADPRAYAMLSELNVKPRTRYLARIRNRHRWLLAHDDSGHDDSHERHANERHS